MSKKKCATPTPTGFEKLSELFAEGYDAEFWSDEMETIIFYFTHSQICHYENSTINGLEDPKGSDHLYMLRRLRYALMNKEVPENRHFSKPTKEEEAPNDPTPQSLVDEGALERLRDVIKRLQAQNAALADNVRGWEETVKLMREAKEELKEQNKRLKQELYKPRFSSN